MGARLRRALLVGVGVAAVAMLGVMGVGTASAASPPPLASFFDPGFASGDSFGWSVAVDGRTAVVGAPDSYQGAVYIFTETASGWVQTATLTDPPDAHYFGSSVAIDGPTIVVGASSQLGGLGSAYVYTRAGANGWPTTPTVTLNDPAATNNDLFGASVAVDGSTIVVGAPDNTNDPNNPREGAAYVYTAHGNGWNSTPTTSLYDPAKTAYDLFGTSVAVENNVVAVGAYNGEAAYLYVQGTGNGWPTTPTKTMTSPTPSSCFGCSVALDEDRTLVVGAQYSNAVYIYPWVGGGWSSPTTLGEPGGGGIHFGVSVAVDNGKLIVGDDQAQQGSCANGVAYEFIKGPSGWPTTPSASFTDDGSPYQLCDDRFGGSVAVQGNITVIGAWFVYGVYVPPYGAAYIFSA